MSWSQPPSFSSIFASQASLANLPREQERCAWQLRGFVLLIFNPLGLFYSKERRVLFDSLTEPTQSSRRRLDLTGAVLTTPFLGKGKGGTHTPSSFLLVLCGPGDPYGFHPVVLIAKQSPCHFPPINMDLEALCALVSLPSAQTSPSLPHQEAPAHHRLLDGCQLGLS